MDKTLQSTESQQTPTQQGDQNDGLLSSEDLRQKALQTVEEKKQAPEVKEEVTPAPQEPTLNADKLAIANAKLEKALRDQKAEIEQLQAARDEYNALVERLKGEDRYKVIEEHGGDLADWTQRVIEGKQPQKDPRDLELEEMRAQMFEMRQIIEDRQTQETETQQAARRQQAVDYTKKFLEDNEDFPFCRALNLEHAIVNSATEKAGQGLPIVEHEIAAEIEKQSVAEVKKQLTSLSQFAAFNTLLEELGYKKQTKKEPSEQEKDQDLTPQPGSKTLTNDLSAEPSGNFNYNAAEVDGKTLRQHAAKVALENSARRMKEKGLDDRYKNV